MDSFPARLLRVLASGPLSKMNAARALARKNVDGQLHRTINELLASGLIARTIPDKPNSRLQQYRLTEKGRKMIAAVIR